MKFLKNTFVLVFSLISSISGALAQEMPFYEVEYGFKGFPNNFNTAGGANLWNPPLGPTNSVDITNYLIASETEKGYADSLSSVGISIGFDFPFAGDTFDVFGVSSKGYIVLGKREEGLRIYADTLRYEANDTIFTKRNPFLISVLLNGKNMDKMNSISIDMADIGFSGKRGLTISFSSTYMIPGSSASSMFFSYSALALYEDGSIEVKFYSSLNNNSYPFESLGFITQRYGGKSILSIYTNTNYDKLETFYGEAIKFGIFNNNNYPQIQGNTYSTIYATPKPLLLSTPKPFTWDLQGRQGKSTGYYDNDYSLLQEDTINTSNTVWWYAPQYEPISYDAYLGTDTLSMSLLGTNITGDSVNPRNGFQKVPLASLQLDSLAPSTQYYLKIVSKSATDSLLSYTSFYTDSIEEAYNYCTNMSISPFFTAPLGEIHFNEMLFINPSSQWDQHLVPDTGNWTTTLSRGAEYTLSVKAMPDFAVTLFNLKAYIDFNQNGIFEPEEGFFTPQILAENRFTDISIPIPKDAYIGKTRMRFVLPFTTTNQATISPCSVSEYLDFTVTIVQPDSCKELDYALTQLPACFNGQNGALNLSPSGGIPPYKIQWNTGNATDTLTTLSGLAVNAMHRASITDSRGCKLRTTMAIVNQNSPLRVDTSLLSQTKLLLLGETAPYEVEITAINTNTQTLYTDVNDTLNLHNLPDGIYTVKVTDTYTCSYNLGEIKLLHTGILRDRAVKEVILYPNPATTYTTVQGLKNFTTKIYSSKGDLIKQLNDDNGQLYLADLNSGLYILLISQDKELYSQKLLVK